VAESAASNIPGVDFASVTVFESQDSPRTVAATDSLAQAVDELQYALREGPCYAAVTADRLVLVNDVASAQEFPRYGARAAALGVHSQLAVQLVDDGDRAGLNLYALQPQAFDHATVRMAELFASQAAPLLDFAVRVEQLDEALQARTGIDTAVGILMERHHVDRGAALEILAQGSRRRDLELGAVAQEVITGTVSPDVAR
jgi:hypothetical protein